MPSQLKDCISMNVLYLVVLLASWYKLAILPVMVSCIHHGIRKLATKYLKHAACCPRNQVPNPRVESPYMYLVIWFTQHCPPLMAAATPSGANNALLQRCKPGDEFKDEPIPLDDDEEKADYEHEDTDAYLIKPDDEGFDGNTCGSSYIPDIESMGEAIPTSFPAGGHFQHVVNFEDASSILEPASTIDMTKAPAPAPVSLVWRKLIIH
ncbi:uncharacterized protein A4U43_C02F8570 [Asparagus officinalis]|uniref:Uncharacterized protein n=1 Tax=Asparagus officinalis TaxID=4686 RepID=A0A5P1FGW4_ASPOF|nr:uncharacterized protein A4U43_C02F8570 [Asparagus officinalis]